MSYDEKMTVDERRKYLHRLKPRYIKADRRAKGSLLDEMVTVTGLDRKSLIRLMNGSLERKARHRQRGATYGPAVDDALRVIHESADFICAERLTPNLVWLARHQMEDGGWSLATLGPTNTSVDDCIMRSRPIIHTTKRLLILGSPNRDSCGKTYRQSRVAGSSRFSGTSSFPS